MRINTEQQHNQTISIDEMTSSTSITGDIHLDPIIHGVQSGASQKIIQKLVGNFPARDYINPLITSLFNELYHKDAALTFQCIEALAKAGVNLNDTDFEGRMILHEIDKNNTDAIGFLAKMGANVNSQDLDGNTPLHLQTYHDNYNNATALIKSGANSNVRNKKLHTPLHVAARFGNCERSNQLIKQMVESGADVRATDTDGNTAMHYIAATWSGNYFDDLMKICPDLKLCLDVANNDGNTPLHYMVLERIYPDPREVGRVDLLVACGADINHINNNEQTLLKCTFNPALANYIAHHPQYKHLKTGSLNKHYKVYKNNFRTKTVYDACAKLSNNFNSLISKASQKNLLKIVAAVQQKKQATVVQSTPQKLTRKL